MSLSPSYCELQILHEVMAWMDGSDEEEPPEVEDAERRRKSKRKEGPYITNSLE